MYEETKVKFDWKGFLIKFILLLLVIILVIKLLPFQRKSEGKTSENFNANLTEFKDAASKYFNADNLPTNEEDAKTITLEELEAIGKVNTLETEDGDPCDTENSFIKATKKEDGYEIEVHLICGTESNSKYVYLDNDSTSTTTTTTSTTETTTTKKVSSSYSGSSKKTGSVTTKKTTTKKTTSGKTKSYTVIFNANKGTSVASQTIKANGVATRPTDPIRNGYTFLGWYRNGSVYNFNTKVTENVYLSAKWKLNGSSSAQWVSNKISEPTKKAEEVNSYVVSFDTKGGTNIASQTINEGNKAKRPEVPVKLGYVFNDWYLNGKPYSFDSEVSGNITLVAKYRALKEYSENIYSAGGDPSGLKTYTVKHTLAIPSNLTGYNEVKIKSLSFIKSMNSSDDMAKYNASHRGSYEYTYGYNDSYSNTNPAILANIGNVIVKKAYSDPFDRSVTWTGDVLSDCKTKYNGNWCMYGIVYNVTWSYEVEE